MFYLHYYDEVYLFPQEPNDMFVILAQGYFNLNINLICRFETL